MSSIKILKCFCYYDYYLSGLCEWNREARYFVWTDDLAGEMEYSVFDIDYEPPSWDWLIENKVAVLGKFSSANADFSLLRNENE